MILALYIVFGIVTYLAIGASYSRARQVALRNRILERESRRYPILYEDGELRPIDEGDLTLMLIWRAVLWPWGIVVDYAIPPFRQWFYQPLERTQQRKQRRREDIAHWRSVLRDPLSSPEEQDTARRLIKILEDHDT